MSGIAATSLPTSLRLSLSSRWSELAAGLYGVAVVGIVAGSSGGFLPTTWGWTAVVTLWIATIGLLLRERVRIRTLELAYVAAMLGFTAWVALSNLWTPSVTSTMHEVQRDIAYIGVIAAGVVLVRSRSVPHLLGGVLVGIVLDSLYGLGTRLFPAHFGGFDSTSYDYRLSAPITYWNGLGLFATIGLLLALGFTVRGRHLTTRGLGAAALPLLAVTIYLTFSRGAWYALGVGLVVAIAVDPRRLQLVATSLAVVPWTILAIVGVRRESGLVVADSPVTQATHDGHHFALALIVLAAISAGCAVAAGVAERRLQVPRPVRVGFAIVLLVMLAAGVAGALHKEGSPEAFARRAWHSFEWGDVQSNGNVGARLTSLSANGRIPLWRVSLRDFEHAPILGEGAGTFWQAWARYRTIASNNTEAHSLYLGVMGELGIVGLMLLVVFLAVPVVAAFRYRARRLVPLALGAYTAWAFHAGFDWDWQLLGVTIPALLCGVALVKSAPRPGRALGWTSRSVAVVGFGSLLLFALVVLVVDLRLRSAAAEASTNPRAALSSARRAERLAPWSSEPYLVMAEAYRHEQEPLAARNALERAISKDSSSWLLWRQLANSTTGALHRRAQARAAVLNPIESGA